MASTFAVQCPSCDRSFTVSERARGKTLPCPHCDDPVSVPAITSHPSSDPGGYRCPFCGSRRKPHRESCVSPVGWAFFWGTLLILCGIPICWIGLLIREQRDVCPDCRTKIA